MSIREKILQGLQQENREKTPLPELKKYPITFDNAVEKFETVLVAIGGRVIRISGWQDIIDFVKKDFAAAQRIVTPVQELSPLMRKEDINNDPHAYHDVDLVILKPHFAVAENSAAWITDEQMMDRALPFIAQHIALIVRADSIVPTMHDAYDRIGASQHQFGTFIAGPSKTADIEQSLVLGAHGPKSMTVFLWTN